MREAQFNSEVMKSLKSHGYWCYKIPDSPASWTMDRTRFTADKPFDIVACTYGGQMIAIEGKQTKKFESFGLKNMRDSQIENLEKVHKLGGKALVFLNVRIKPDKSKGQKRVDRLIPFEWTEIRDRKESFKKQEIMDRQYIEKKTFGDERLYDLGEYLVSL